MNSDQLPSFDFDPPLGYVWLWERALVDFVAFGRLQPWMYLDSAQTFSPTEHWPNGPSSARLVAFARRQDNDDFACFELDGRSVRSLVVIHGWTSSGYDIVARYGDFWQWLKSVIDDVAVWAETGEE